MPTKTNPTTVTSPQHSGLYTVTALFLIPKISIISYLRNLQDILGRARLSKVHGSLGKHAPNIPKYTTIRHMAPIVPGNACHCTRHSHLRSKEWFQEVKKNYESKLAMTSSNQILTVKMQHTKVEWLKSRWLLYPILVIHLPLGKRLPSTFTPSKTNNDALQQPAASVVACCVWSWDSFLLQPGVWRHFCAI